MEDLGIDIYVNSFPLRGARASVEVMSSGTPVIWYVESDATYFHDTHMKYPEAAEWRHPRQLFELIAGATPEWIENQADAARRWYVENHRLSILTQCLTTSQAVSGWQPPSVHAA